MRNVLLSTLQTLLNKIITFDFFFWKIKKYFDILKKKNHNKVHGFYLRYFVSQCSIVSMFWAHLGFMPWNRVRLVILISHSCYWIMNTYVNCMHHFVKCIKSSLNCSIDPGWNDLKNIENIVYCETWYYNLVPVTSSRLFFSECQNEFIFVQKKNLK